ncbi:MAG TPA: hypothetical protein VFE24_01175 [Pirellulales bacterium]|jgi:TIGR03009 family protein|nr:hypothetical protein [Pirellulales bacterium]
MKRLPSWLLAAILCFTLALAVRAGGPTAPSRYSEANPGPSGAYAAAPQNQNPNAAANPNYNRPSAANPNGANPNINSPNGATPNGANAAAGITQIHSNAGAPRPVQAAVPQTPVEPFHLSPEQAEQVDRLLAAWEKKQVHQFTATFDRVTYDLNFAPKEKNYLLETAKGLVKYQAPDKGQFKIDGTQRLNMSKAKYDEANKTWDFSKVTYDAVPDSTEEWRCNGKSIFEFKYHEKQLVEHILPKELQGKAIIESPLPFVFGAEATKIKQRYWVRIITPADVKEGAWLEAFPRTLKDASNYQCVQIILDKMLVPTGLRIVSPGGKTIQVYGFRPATEIWNPFATDFSNPGVPFGWKSVIDEGAVQPPNGPANGPNDANSQARRLSPLAPPRN